MTGLTCVLCQLTHAAPLYQWTDKDGSTRMTAESPPAHATNISRVFQSDPPPMNDRYMPPARGSASSILQPQNQYDSDAYRRMQNRMDDMRSSDERRWQAEMVEREAREAYYRDRDQDSSYDYGYEAAYKDYDDYYYNSRPPEEAPAPPEASAAAAPAEMSGTARVVADTSSKVAEAASRAFGSAYRKR